MEIFEHLDVIEDKLKAMTMKPNQITNGKFEHRNPFTSMKIDDNQFLMQINGRSACPKCGKSRKLFCYTCYVPIVELKPHLPTVQLPIQIDIIKHQREVDGKSTAIHAAILAPANVNIYTYPNIPDYNSADDAKTVLIFPTHNSIHVDGFFDEHVRLENVEDLQLPKGINRSTLLKHRLNEISTHDDRNVSAIAQSNRNQTTFTCDNLPIKRAVIIDSTWNQCKSIFNDGRLKQLKTVVLQNRLSQFWRHQKGSPRWFLATIEAIHQFLLEVHINAWGLDRSYRTALDSLEIQTDFIRDELIIDVNQWNRPQPHDDDDDADATSKLYAPYNGQYDNLFFFFTHMYQLIHYHYDHNKLLAYKRPII